MKNDFRPRPLSRWRCDEAASCQRACLSVGQRSVKHLPISHTGCGWELSARCECQGGRGGGRETWSGKKRKSWVREGERVRDLDWKKERESERESEREREREREEESSVFPGALGSLVAGCCAVAVVAWLVSPGGGTSPHWSPESHSLTCAVRSCHGSLARIDCPNYSAGLPAAHQRPLHRQ